MAMERKPKKTRETRNDSDREDFIINDEGLYAWQKSSRLPMRKFIRENRAAIDEVINNVNSGARSNSYLIYG